MAQAAELHLTEAHAEHDEHRDDIGSKLGMWFFLFTEILLFGGLFIVYSVYRFKHAEAFATASAELDVFIGTINTLVLITSSMTVAMSISAIQRKKPRLAINLLWFTIFCAGVFMFNKYFEWGHKFDHGIYPGSSIFPGGSTAREAWQVTPSEVFAPAEGMFFVLYYLMTGLHGLHVIIGSIFIIVIIAKIKRGTQSHDNFAQHENAGLYWHLVDLIWIYLFPLMYLI